MPPSVGPPGGNSMPLMIFCSVLLPDDPEETVGDGVGGVVGVESDDKLGRSSTMFS